MKKKLSIVSSYSDDRLIDGNTDKVMKNMAGGPALFMTNALRKIGIEPVVYMGNRLFVDVKVYDGNEYGRVKVQPVPLKFPFPEEEICIFSTILREWSLDGINNYNGRIFMDIQGYVRDCSDFGKKKMWRDTGTYVPFLFCLKGNEEEMQFIPEDVLSEQKAKKMLITTYGSKGVIINYKSKQYYIEPMQRVLSPHTIGAGDTFFANFVAKFIETQDVEVSGRFAVEKTGEFLETL